MATEENVLPPVFTAEEIKGFSELRINSIVEAIARQRDQAFNGQTRAEAELAVKTRQVEVLSNRLMAQASMSAGVAQELEATRGLLAEKTVQLVQAQAEIERIWPLIQAELPSDFPSVALVTEVPLDDAFGDRP